jgi:hypothetical protein
MQAHPIDFCGRDFVYTYLSKEHLLRISKIYNVPRAKIENKF